MRETVLSPEKTASTPSAIVGLVKLNERRDKVAGVGTVTLPAGMSAEEAARLVREADEAQRERDRA